MIVINQNNNIKFIEKSIDIDIKINFLSHSSLDNHLYKNSFLIL